MPLSWPRWSKTVPEIQFFLDDSLEYIEQIDRAMHREE